MGRYYFYLQIILVLGFLISLSSVPNSIAHEDEGDKKRDDRIYMSLTNDSPNRRTGVTFYYTSISHTGHDHPWIGDSGVIICELGSMNPGQTKTCHGPFHSTKSPDQKPECSPVSDWSFSFLVSYNEGGNQKSVPVQRGTITSAVADEGESRGFSWDAHTDQIFLDEDCPKPEIPLPPPLVALDPPSPPTVAVSDSEGANPTLSGTGDVGTEISIFISEIGFFGFNFFWADSVMVNEDGDWIVKLPGPLDNGVYDVTIVSVDKKDGLTSDPVNDVFVVDRDPPKQPDNTCGVGIPEPKKDDVVAPFVPLPRINGTSDLDPDLSRDDKGANDCALIAVTNNLNYFVNSHNIPRGEQPGQLPSDDSKIIEELRIDMNWQARGVVDADFIKGKNTFVQRHNLPITTTFTQFPTPEQIEEALNSGKAIELNFQFKKRGTVLGHTVTVVGINRTSEGVTIQIHDPMTKGGKTQDSYELRQAQDRSGNSFWILMEYPNWDGYTILEGMFVQEYATANNSSNTSVPPSNTSRGTILDNGTGSIPSWVKNIADWWSKNLVSDKEFASSLGFLVQEKIIRVDGVEVDSQGSLRISDNVSIPKWIQTNAKWWVSGQIPDEDFKQGIQFMIQEKVIDFSGEDNLQKTNSSFVSHADFEDFVQMQSNMVVGSVFALEQLLELQNFLASFFDDSADTAWNQYGEDKKPEKMEQASKLEEQARFFKNESLITVQTLKDSKEKSKTFFDKIREMGFDDFVLKKNSEEEFSNDTPLKIRESNDFEKAENNLKNIEKVIKSSSERAEFLGGVQIGDLPENGESQSSRYSFSFGQSSVEDQTSESHGIDSLSWAKSCSANADCNPSLGESCSPRQNENRCIPTWFGIKHGWSPFSSNSSESTTETYENLPSETPESETPKSETPESKTYQVSVVLIKGGYFPVAQFSTWQWKGECDDATHYHSNSGHAISTTLQTLGDPDPNECGFGKVSNLPITSVSMSEDQIQAFIEMTSVDPRNNKAMFGGSGP